MKIGSLQKHLAALSLATGLGMAVSAAAQTAVVVNPPPANVQLSSGAMQVFQLEQARVSEGKVIAYIRNSRINYALTPDQMVWLRNNGVPDKVMTAMLDQSKLVASGAVMPAVFTDTLPVYTIGAPEVVVEPDYYYYPWDYPWYFYGPYYGAYYGAYYYGPHGYYAHGYYGHGYYGHGYYGGHGGGGYRGGGWHH